MSRAGGVLRQERQAPVSGDFPGKDLLRGGERFPVGDLLRVGACFPVGELLRAGACFPVGDFLPAGGRLPVNYGLLRWEYSPENEKLQAQARRLAGKRFPTSGSFPAASLILQQAGPPAQEILFLGPREGSCAQDPYSSPFRRQPRRQCLCCLEDGSESRRSQRAGDALENGIRIRGAARIWIG